MLCFFILRKKSSNFFKKLSSMFFSQKNDGFLFLGFIIFGSFLPSNALGGGRGGSHGGHGSSHGSSHGSHGDGHGNSHGEYHNGHHSAPPTITRCGCGGGHHQNFEPAESMKISWEKIKNIFKKHSTKDIDEALWKIFSFLLTFLLKVILFILAKAVLIK